MAANAGTAGLFAVGDANPIVAGAAGILLDILSETIGATTGVIDGNGLKGTRSRYASRVRNGNIDVGGSFSLNPVTSDLAYLLPKILGTAASGTTYALADTVPSFVIQKKTGSSGNRVFTYPTNYITRATFSGTRGQPLRLDCDVLGLTEESPGSSLASFTLNTANAMFVFSDLTLNLASSNYNCHDFSITIDNGLQIQAVNSRVATAIFATDRIITVSHSMPEADVTYASFSDAEVAVVATFSALSQTLVFTLPAVRYTNMTPKMTDRGEIKHMLHGQAFRTSGSAELVTTCDSTP